MTDTIPQKPECHAVGDTNHNSSKLAVATAIALYGPESGAALATVVEVLVEMRVMLSVMAVCSRTLRWFA